MVELKGQTPFGDLLPLKIGGMTVAACDMGQLTVLGAFDRAGPSKAMPAACGLVGMKCCSSVLRRARR